MIRIIVFGGLYWGAPILGNDQILSPLVYIGSILCVFAIRWCGAGVDRPPQKVGSSLCNHFLADPGFRFKALLETLNPKLLFPFRGLAAFVGHLLGTRVGVRVEPLKILAYTLIPDPFHHQSHRELASCRGYSSLKACSTCL